jgi:hypothetical protein
MRFEDYFFHTTWKKKKYFKLDLKFCEERGKFENPKSLFLWISNEIRQSCFDLTGFMMLTLHFLNSTSRKKNYLVDLYTS